jgi:hypothetical protein
MMLRLADGPDVPLDSGGLAELFMLPNRAVGLIKRGASVPPWPG